MPNKFQQSKHWIISQVDRPKYKFCNANKHITSRQLIVVPTLGETSHRVEETVFDEPCGVFLHRVVIRSRWLSRTVSELNVLWEALLCLALTVL